MTMLLKFLSYRLCSNSLIALIMKMCSACSNIQSFSSGVWEVPLNAHYVETYEGGHCPYLDQCVLHNHDPDEVFEWLREDFNRYYLQNRAPYMMPFHTNWFQIKELERGLHKFLDWTKTL